MTIEYGLCILKALVEQGDMRLGNVRDPKIRSGSNMILVAALVEGAKAVLAGYKDAWDTNKHGEPGPDDATIAYWRGKREQAGIAVIDSAQAYAPRMLEAGMKVPEE